MFLRRRVRWKYCPGGTSPPVAALFPSSLLVCKPALRRGELAGDEECMSPIRKLVFLTPRAKNSLPKYFRLFLVLGLVCVTGEWEQLDSTWGRVCLFPTNPNAPERGDRSNSLAGAIGCVTGGVVATYRLDVRFLRLGVGLVSEGAPVEAGNRTGNGVNQE